MGVSWDLLMFIGSSLCHQLPERSYLFGDLQMPLCARCIGIHLGFALSFAFLFIGPKRFSSAIPTPKQVTVLCAIMAFFFVDSVLSYSGLNESDNLRRTLSGLSLGVPLPFFLVPMLNHLLFPGRNPTGVFARRRDWAAVPVIYAVGALLILPSERAGALFYLVSLIGVIGVLLFYSTGISVMVLLGTEGKRPSARTKTLVSVLLAMIVLVMLALVHDVLY